MGSAIAIIGEVDTFEIVQRRLFAPAHPFVQRTRDPIETGIQFLARVGLVVMRQQRDACVREQFDSGQQVVCHASLPRVHTIGVCGRCRAPDSR